MSDNLRQYRAIRDGLIPGYPGKPHGRCARHLAPLAALLSGIVASKSTHLPQVAAKAPDRPKPESRVKRFARWVENARSTPEGYLVPYAEMLLGPLAFQTLVLIIDGRVVGRGCVALMIHVVYKGRALPLAWVVRRGQKGHFPEALHIALLEQVQELIPPGARVVVLGDGECDGTHLPHTLHEAGWWYGCRTGSHRTASWAGLPLRLETVGACIKPGTLVEFPQAALTRNAYGPVLLLCCWAQGYQEPLYLISNRASAEEACRLYTKRFRIETCFSDQKSRGFHLHKSHLADRERLSRLLMAACLAYIWIISLGAVCVQDGWMTVIHRGERCDVSLFQLGLRLLDHLLNEDFTIPVAFYIVI